MQKSNTPSGKNNEPIWFTKDSTTKTIVPNKDTYQTIKTNKVEGGVTEINLGSTSPYKIMVCTPCHSDVRAEMLSHEDNYTHLLFIDSDIDFNGSTIFKMLDLDKDVISCPYPMKMLSWDKMWRRYHEKVDAIKTADDLAKSGYTFPVKIEDPNNIQSEKGVIELSHAPTGCMLIKRQVLEKMIKEYPELEIFQPTIINGKEVKKDNMYNLFDTLHDPKTKRYFGEDFGFCQRWADIGGKVHAYINDYITHVGEYSYCGRFRDDLWQGSRPLKSVDEPKKIK
jgi:hypothetical protein